MVEKQFSESFDKMLKHLNKNIKNINGVDYYLIPVKTINELKRLFNQQENNNNVDYNDQDDDFDESENVEYYHPIF